MSKLLPRDKEILDFYKKGWTRSALSDRFNVSRQRIDQILWKMDPSIRKPINMSKQRLISFCKRNKIDIQSVEDINIPNDDLKFLLDSKDEKFSIDYLFAKGAKKMSFDKKKERLAVEDFISKNKVKGKDLVFTLTDLYKLLPNMDSAKISKALQNMFSTQIVDREGPGIYVVRDKTNKSLSSPKEKDKSKSNKKKNNTDLHRDLKTRGGSRSLLNFLQITSETVFTVEYTLKKFNEYYNTNFSKSTINGYLVTLTGHGYLKRTLRGTYEKTDKLTGNSQHKNSTEDKANNSEKVVHQATSEFIIYV